MSLRVESGGIGRLNEDGASVNAIRLPNASLANVRVNKKITIYFVIPLKITIFAQDFVKCTFMAKILVIDDERAIRNALKDILDFEGYTVELAENGRIGLEKALSAHYDLIYTDIKMPEMDGMEVLEAYRKTIAEQGGEEAPIVMISGHGTVETAVESIKKGAFDFIQKPLDLNRLLVTTQRAIEHKSLVQETKVLRKKIGARNKMVGESAAIERVREIIEKVAPTEARVLITGSNGTGKEVVAHLIHENSTRAKKPMVEVNCAAIPSELIESELFGHTKGSFTSAIKDRAGKFEQADGGTLFPDEIGDMSLSAQAKVLRALQENEITRVGSDKAIKVNVRVLAATNKDLKREIAEGRFREDLFHRLNVIPIHVPALDDRKDDIPLLVSHFADLICKEQGTKTKAFSVDAMTALQERTWPGNIRELRNVIERLIILGGDVITADDVNVFG
jgi:DNA-binding NtrC family response regulator